jgi:hypothetical protein
MPAPFHEFDSEAQQEALREAWYHCTYPWDALMPGVQWLIRPNGEVPVSWADLSAFSGIQRVEGPAWTAMSYWQNFDPLLHAEGEHITDEPRPPEVARGYIIGDAYAVAWDDGRIQLDLELMRSGAPLAEAVFAAGAALVDQLVLNPAQRREVHMAWEPNELAPECYEEAGNLDYWRRCSQQFQAGFVSAFSDITPQFLPAPRTSRLVSTIRDVAVPP